MIDLCLMDIRRVAQNRATAAEKVRAAYPERMQKASRLAREEDRLRSLAAGLLLCEVLGAPEILYEEGGKPYAAGGPHFNLSHSGDYAFLAVDDGPVGVDAEKWEPWFEAEWRALSRHSFHEEERAALEKSAAPLGAPPAKVFFDLWTLKESYMKMLGKGFSLDPASFAVKIDGCRARVATDRRARLRLYGLAGYSVSLCSLHDGPRAIREVEAV